MNETEGTVLTALTTIETGIGQIKAALEGLEGEERTDALLVAERRIGRTLATFKPEKKERQTRNGKGAK